MSSPALSAVPPLTDGLVEQEGRGVARAGARRVDAPILEAAAGAVAAALRAELRKQRDIAVGGVVDEIAVGDVDAHVALAASRREPRVDRDPMVAALVEVVGQVVGMGAGKSRAGGIVD